MNYEKIYNELCIRGKNQRPLEYTEKHHIIPKCMGGGNDKSNLTALSVREHFLAHYLLTKMYPDNPKLFFALSGMIRFNNIQSRKFTPRQYLIMDAARKKYNPMHNEKIKTYFSEKFKGRICYNNGISNSYFYPYETIPEGFVKGNITNNKHLFGRACYNNGNINKYFYPHEIIPEGFVKGNKPYKQIRNGKEIYYNGCN